MTVQPASRWRGRPMSEVGPISSVSRCPWSVRSTPDCSRHNPRLAAGLVSVAHDETDVTARPVKASARVVLDLADYLVREGRKQI